MVQYDVKTGKRKVLAFLHPFYKNKYGCALKGSYSLAVDPKGDKLFITWNANRGPQGVGQRCTDNRPHSGGERKP